MCYSVEVRRNFTTSGVLFHHRDSTPVARVGRIAKNCEMNKFLTYDSTHLAGSAACNSQLFCQHSLLKSYYDDEIAYSD